MHQKVRLFFASVTQCAGISYIEYKATFLYSLFHVFSLIFLIYEYPTPTLSAVTVTLVRACLSGERSVPLHIHYVSLFTFWLESAVTRIDGCTPAILKNMRGWFCPF